MRRLVFAPRLLWPFSFKKKMYPASHAAVVAKGWADHQEQPVDQTVPEADRRNVPDGSSQTSCSSTSSEDESSALEPAMSEVSAGARLSEHQGCFLCQ